MEMNFASRGIGNAALATGVTGLSLAAANTLGINPLQWIGGARNVCPDNMPVSRFELEQQNQITNRDMEIAFLRGRDAAKSDLLELYRYFDGRDREREAQINAVATSVAVSNTQTASAIAFLQQSVDMLKGLTKVNIPVTSVCPQPMLQYNSWTAPTTTTTTTAG